MNFGFEGFEEFEVFQIGSGGFRWFQDFTLWFPGFRLLIGFPGVIRIDF
jgi:hypothetical protein